MLSVGKIGAGGASPAYYVDQVATGREDYYTGSGEAKGTWQGRGAADSDLHGDVDHDAFLAMLAPQSVQQTVMGYDLTFSAPKSVSVLYGIADMELSLKVRDAHDAAVSQALGYLEREATWTRRGAGGKQLIEGDRLTAATFRHRSSRAGDPQLHTHTVIANTLQAEGRTTALDGRALYAHAKTAGYLYQAALRAQLTETVGVAWEPVTKGVAEISGITPAVRKHFSQRSQEIADHLENSTNGRSRRARELAALESRRVKSHDVPADRLHQDWRARAQEHGLGQAELDALLDRRAAGPDRQPDLAEQARHLASPHGLTRNASTFDRRDVVQAWAGAHRDGVASGRVEQLADRWLATSDAVAVEPAAARPITGQRHSTPELLATEQQLLAGARERQGGGAGRIPHPTPTTTQHDHELSSEQQAGVDALTTSGDGIQVVRAAAGTGKTRMLGAARHAWDTGGYRTIGCALSARAAFELEAQTGIDSTTIAHLKKDLDSGNTLEPDVVLVVDEAGMVGTRDLHHLAHHAARAGAKLVLVGDDRQLPEIEAGGAFSALAQQPGTVQLHDVRRQREAWDRDALAALRHGDVEQWADTYRDHGRLIARPTAAQARDALVSDWWHAAQQPDTDALMLAHRRKDVADLNARARALMQGGGRLNGEHVDAGGREYAVGDSVLAKHNDRQLGVINGARGTITHVNVEQRSVHVDFDRADTVELDARYLDDGHLDYGYAMTAHAAQGLTVNRTYVLGTDDLYREWGYTALTRHTDQARFFAVSTGSTERCLPGLQPEDDPLTRDIETALGASRQQQLAGTSSRSEDDELREQLTNPARALTRRIGTRPASPLDRDQWAKAAANLLRSPNWRPTLQLDIAPALEPALDLSL